MKRLMMCMAVMCFFSQMYVNAEIKVTGLIQTQFVYDKAAVNCESSFSINRVRISAKTDVNDKVDLYSQIDLFTADRNVLDAVLGYKLNSIHKIGVGRFTIPFGLQNSISAYNLETIFYAQSVSNQFGNGARDMGIKYSGSIDKFSWIIAILNGLDWGAAVYSNVDNNDAKDITGRIGFDINKNTCIGVSGYFGKADPAKTVRDRVGLDAKYNKDELSAQAEYIQGKTNNVNSMGYYLEAGYKINKIQPVLRFDYYDGNVDVSDASEIMIYALGANYHIDKDSKLQFIYEIKNDKSDPGMTDKDNNKGTLQFAVKF